MHISLQLCQAIFFMHMSETPIAHLDIKSENVLVCVLVCGINEMIHNGLGIVEHELAIFEWLKPVTSILIRKCIYIIFVAAGLKMMV